MVESAYVHWKSDRQAGLASILWLLPDFGQSTSSISCWRQSARIARGPGHPWKDIDLKSEKPTVTVNGTIVHTPRHRALPSRITPRAPIPARKNNFLPAFAVEMLRGRKLASWKRLGTWSSLCRWNAPRPNKLPQTVVHGA